jgi:hypothetical protein
VTKLRQRCKGAANREPGRSGAAALPSSLWLLLVTPLYARVGRKLIEGVRNETVVRDDRARCAFDVQPLGIRAAVASALA